MTILTSRSGHRYVRALLAVLWAAIVTLTLQFWVGERTVYATGVSERVEAAHRSMLTNTPPGGESWAASGMNGVNIRIVPVLLAEGMHRASGLSVARSYFALDCIFLFVSLLALLAFAMRFASRETALVIASGTSALLPLTYQLFWYHPWDRLSMLCWIGLLWLLHARKLLAFGLLLPLAVAVKYDIMLLPAVHVLRSLFESRRLVLRELMQGAALFVVGIGTYASLRLLRPDGFASTPIVEQVTRNIQVIQEMHVRWPPLLGFTLPVCLAILGLRHADGFGRASALFAGLLMIPFSLQSNLAEFRAHIPVILLLIPAVGAGLQRVLSSDASWVNEPTKISAH